MLRDGQNSRRVGIETVLDEVSSTLHKGVRVECRRGAHVVHSICSKVAFGEIGERGNIQGYDPWGKRIVLNSLSNGESLKAFE